MKWKKVCFEKKSLEVFIGISLLLGSLVDIGHNSLRLFDARVNLIMMSTVMMMTEMIMMMIMIFFIRSVWVLAMSSEPCLHFPFGIFSKS